MPNKIKNQLIKLQKEKTELFLEIEKQKKNKEKENLKNSRKRMTEIQNEMANLNKLDDKEKNIHAIWIGILPKGEFDNLKVWAKYNQEYKIHIWTNSTHILTHKLNNIISTNSKITNNNETTHDYEIEAKLKDEFYYSYQLKNPTKTFDENVKQFLLDKGYPNENEINNLIKNGKEKLIQEIEDIKNYTTNEVILHDINQENDIFPTEKYKEGYLNTLEHLHICAGASDRLRYAILNKFGGVYLDTDVMPKFNLEEIEKKQEINILVNSVEWNEHYNYPILKKKTNLIINQIFILANLNQLNDKNLKDFAKNWEKSFQGNSDKNFEIFKQIAKQFKNLNLKLEPEMKLSEFPINNILQIGCHINKVTFCNRVKNTFPNSFIISKANSNFLQKLMKKIEVTDQKIKRNQDMNTYNKLINKNKMIQYHTGPNNLLHTIEENDSTYFHNLETLSTKIITPILESINSLESSWFNLNPSQHAISTISDLKNHFWSSDEEVLNYKEQTNDEPKINESILYSKFMKEERKKNKKDISSNFKFEKEEFLF